MASTVEVILVFLGLVLVVLEVTGPQVAPTQLDPTVPSLITRSFFTRTFLQRILLYKGSFIKVMPAVPAVLMLVSCFRPETKVNLRARGAGT